MWIVFIEFDLNYLTLSLPFKIRNENGGEYTQLKCQKSLVSWNYTKLIMLYFDRFYENIMDLLNSSFYKLHKNVKPTLYIIEIIECTIRNKIFSLRGLMYFSS